MGVLLYDMLTGTVPFNALDRASVHAMQVTTAPKPPSQVNPNLPANLDSVILKALTPHAEGSYESPQEFLRALAAVAAVPDAPSAPMTAAEMAEMQGTLPGIEPPPAPPMEEGPLHLLHGLWADQRRRKGVVHRLLGGSGEKRRCSGTEGCPDGGEAAQVEATRQDCQSRRSVGRSGGCRIGRDTDYGHQAAPGHAVFRHELSVRSRGVGHDTPGVHRPGAGPG